MYKYVDKQWSVCVKAFVSGLKDVGTESQLCNCRQWSLYDRALPFGALLFTLSYWAIGLTVAKLWPQYKHHC